jgi:hypothetical protein
MMPRRSGLKPPELSFDSFFKGNDAMLGRFIPVLSAMLLFAATSSASAAATPKFTSGEYTMALTVDGKTHSTAAIVENDDGKLTIKKKSDPTDAPFIGKLVGDQMTAEAKDDDRSFQLKGKITADDEVNGEAILTRATGTPMTAKFKLSKVAK